MMEFGRDQSEAADCYLLGAYLGSIASCIGRRVYFPWGSRKWFPNLFLMLVGRPGDRKSDALSVSEELLHDVIDCNRFLPSLFSKEALVDEYDHECGGSPDKVMLVSDGNVLMDNWRSGYGEQAASKFLELYDCGSLAESFKRNQSEESPSGRRLIPQTSTTIVMGTTFNACRFPSKSIQSGLHRRFLFCVAEKRARFIPLPNPVNLALRKEIMGSLRKIAALEPTECRFSASAEEFFVDYQRSNRSAIDVTRDEQERSRLNGSPSHVMKLAMIFSVSKWSIAGYSTWDGEIDVQSIQLAAEYVDHAAESAALLDSLAHAEQIKVSAAVDSGMFSGG